MAAQSKNILMSIGVLLLAVSACAGPPAPPTAGPDYPGTLTAIAQTLSAGTATLPVDVASATLTTDVIPSATGIPPTTATDVPILLTATFTAIPSPTVPMVSVTTATNCRTGPGRVYHLVGGADVGIKFLLVGKSTSTNYWIIRLSDGRECWLWGQHAIVEGNVNALPEYAIPATPLPPLGGVAGTITDNLGNPIPNVAVSALVAEKTFVTGSNGRYALDNLRGGTEFITVSASSFRADSRSVTISEGSVVALDIVMFPESSTTMTPTPTTQATVEGVVLLHGSPVPGADVWVMDTSLVAITDSSGRYRFNLGQGSFRILAQLGNARGGVQVSLQADQTTIAPDILLIPR